jgi:hypothetical protein
MDYFSNQLLGSDTNSLERKWGQIFILDIAGRRRASMRLLLKQTESKVKDKDLTPSPRL